jgi:hypothetical protein
MAAASAKKGGDQMVRHRYHITVELGRFNEGLKWARAMNADAQKNGWPEAKMMSPGFGPVNQLILEWEYPDLATFDKVQSEFYVNAETMATFRSGVGLDAPGTHPWDEVEFSIDQDLA